MVHRALELLFMRPNAERTPEALADVVPRRSPSTASTPTSSCCASTPTAAAKLRATAGRWSTSTSRMEDPTAVRDIGLELRLEAQVGALALRGIIDRLELDADGELVVTDYKTGRAPGATTSRRGSPACTSTRSCARRCSASARPPSG